MAWVREQAIERVHNLLELAGFYVTDTHNVRPTTFDLMARRDSLLVILKILKNIDALDPEEAQRLHDLGGLFPASIVVVGQSSGATDLEAGVVYGRYGLSIVAEESLQEFLEKGVHPFLFSSPGGIFARIDGGRLRELREERRLSLGALASAAGVSRRTIQLYEDGAGAEVTVVERIEAYLGEPIAQPIEIFRREVTTRTLSPTPKERAPASSGRKSKEPESDEPKERRPARPRPTGDRMRDVVFRQLDGMGWDVVVTVRCPFDAVSQGPRRTDKELVLTGVGSLRTAQHRADVLHELAKVSEGHAFYVVRDAPARSSIDGLAIVTMHELQRRRDAQELFDLISERESS